MATIKLTQGIIASLECPSGKRNIEYCDIDVRGLYLEVRKAGGGLGTWYFRYKGKSNKTAHERIGSASDITLSDARQKAKQLKAEVSLGADPRFDERERLAVITYDDFFQKHYLPYVQPRKRSWDRDEELYRLRIKDVFGHRRLNQMMRQQIQSFHAAVLAEGLAPATANHHLKLIKHSLNLAVEWGMLDKNPATRIPMFAEDNKVERYMDDAELQRLLHVLKTSPSRSVCLIAIFLLSTGARLNEALLATWNQIDIDKRIWRIPASNSKSKRMRPVPLNESAMSVIDQLNTKGVYEHLFINEKRKKPYVNIHKVWDRIRKEAGLPNLRIHDLRHQFASLLINSGSSLFIVQQLLGHSDPSVTQRYSHLSIKSLEQATSNVSVVVRASDVVALAA
jgi:integrase